MRRICRRSLVCLRLSKSGALICVVADLNVISAARVSPALHYYLSSLH